jgi:hypothetical protein
MRTITPLCGDLGDLPALDFLVARRHHLVIRGQVSPQLETAHATGLVTLWHFLVDDATAGRHPLHIAGPNYATVAHAVAVGHIAVKHVCDGFDSAVRMPGKALDVILGIISAKIIEK